MGLPVAVVTGDAAGGGTGAAGRARAAARCRWRPGRAGPGASVGGWAAPAAVPRGREPLCGLKAAPW